MASLSTKVTPPWPIAKWGTHLSIYLTYPSSQRRTTSGEQRHERGPTTHDYDDHDGGKEKASSTTLRANDKSILMICWWWEGGEDGVHRQNLSLGSAAMAAAGFENTEARDYWEFFLKRIESLLVALFCGGIILDFFSRAPGFEVGILETWSCR
jgi:hypothetical protein